MATIEQVSYNSPDGATLGKDSTEKVGLHGTASVQAAFIATLAGAATIASAVAAINSILLVLSGKGLMASS